MGHSVETHLAAKNLSAEALNSEKAFWKKKLQEAEAKLKEIKDSEESIVQFEKSARTTLDEQRKRMRDNILTEILHLMKELFDVDPF